MVCVRCCYPAIWNVTCRRDFCFIWKTLSRPDICCCINSHNAINIILCLREVLCENCRTYTRDNLIKEI